MTEQLYTMVLKTQVVSNSEKNNRPDSLCAPVPTIISTIIVSVSMCSMYSMYTISLELHRRYTDSSEAWTSHSLLHFQALFFVCLKKNKIIILQEF